MEAILLNTMTVSNEKLHVTQNSDNTFTVRLYDQSPVEGNEDIYDVLTFRQNCNSLTELLHLLDSEIYPS